MTSGIYLIQTGQKFYIGSSYNITARWQVHRWTLRHNKHANRFLQRAWNKYGESAFEFSVLEYCDTAKLIDREQAWIDFFNPPFNLSPTAGSPKGYKHTDSAKLKISQRHKGKTTPEDVRLKIAESVKEKLRQKRLSDGYC